MSTSHREFRIARSFLVPTLRWLPGLLLFMGTIPGVAQNVAPPGNPPRLPPKAVLDAEYLSYGLPTIDQGDRDVCSLFAVTAAAEFEYARSAPNQHSRLSQEYLIWAARAATGKTHEQSMFWEATYGLNKEGICAFDLMPYQMKADPARKPSPAAIQNAKELSERWKVHWIKRWNVTEPLTLVQLTEIKRALAGGHAVACGLRWPKKLNGSDILAVPPPGAVEDGHSIAFTGYEDDPAQPGGGVFHFRNSFGAKWGQDGFGRMSYGYAQAYANDALWLKLEPPGAEAPSHRHEAEAMQVVHAEHCQTSVQNMDQFEGALWSHHEQLFCNAEKGGAVQLRFEVVNPGNYHVRLLATSAPDYGKIRIALDGKPAGPEVDLYAGRVSPTGELELGVHEMAAGPHTLHVVSVGKAAASGGFSFGLDALDLVPAK